MKDFVSNNREYEELDFVYIKSNLISKSMISLCVINLFICSYKNLRKKWNIFFFKVQKYFLNLNLFIYLLFSLELVMQIFTLKENKNTYF